MITNSLNNSASQLFLLVSDCYKSVQLSLIVSDKNCKQLGHFHSKLES